ncbi:type II toxin-antitoxin system RelE/ParE family toxin [Pseudoruegeria sp. HB172150]|uniref:type II toxin-antitoxin system RelE/ParE family toxin n=1 Tax=Pseudoruegeria sp. HB172150 TaxID=2721164 RepID=UPI0015581927|nr:type II toxin-antitoxin system RelE/ParE family toxin [Pseudoruegeria sp. HB172150]
MRLKPRARADLLAIRAWGEDHWGPARARDFLEGLIEKLEELDAHPHIGRPRSVFFDGLRSIRYRGYLAFYILEDDHPVIVAIIHERRNLAALEFADRIEGT